MSVPVTARAWLVLLVAALLIGASSCGDGEQAGGDDVPSVDGADAFPSDSLRQWVSYADHVALYSVADEKERPIDPEEIETDGGIQGRTVTLKTERKIWSATMRDAPRVEVGDRYVAPLARVRDGTGELAWWPLSTGAQFPVVDGRIVLPAPDDQRWKDPLLAQLAGTPLAALEASLDASQPLPLPAKYMNLRPFDRFQAVLAELHEQETVPPGETP